MEEEDRILERERLQIDRIRELDDEELQVEEVDDHHAYVSSDDDGSANGTNVEVEEFTYDAGLASLHAYLGEVEDTHHRMASVDSGTVLSLPLFYLKGAVLFPEATLPLRIIQRSFVLAIERAMIQVDSPYTIGVIRVHRDPDNGRLRFASVGTTAEIRQFRRLEDGSVNVVTRGKQRFHVRRQWIDVDGAPNGEVEIIEEDVPLRTPRGAFGTLPTLSNLSSRSFSHPPNSCVRKSVINGVENDSEEESEESFLTELTSSEMILHQCAIQSHADDDRSDESTSSDSEMYVGESRSSSGSARAKYQRRKETNITGNKTNIRKSPQKEPSWRKRGIAKTLNKFRAVPRAFWPYWVYQMYDSFSLAQKAAEKWKQIVGTPSMDAFMRKPDILSFYIASKLPVSESTRQELLEIDGISYRLRREIELLEGFDCVRCKNCRTVIARRSDMLVMSAEGPLGAYVNPGGYVHEVMTLYEANGLALVGRPSKEYSWFPGYAWTIAECSTCETHMGWLFTATNRKLKPKSFYGIRSSQVADDMC